MEVLRESLAPRVQDRGDSDRAAEVPRIAAEGEQRVRGRAEEQRVDHARIALCERIEVVRQRENDMEVGNREQIGPSSREPPLFRQCLTLRAMAIATGVVGDPYGAAPVTRLPMPAECGGAAGLDRVKRPTLDGDEAVRSTIRVAMGAQDVREFESRTDARDRRAREHGAHGISPAAA